MDKTMEVWLFVWMIAVLVVLIAVSFYILTLWRALRKCSLRSRTMQPGMVFLLWIPLVNLVWQFFVVMGLSNSLGNEFRARGMVNAPREPGKELGLAMCLCSIAGIIPILRVVAGIAGLAGFVLWIMYWVKIAEFSRMLDAPPGMGVPVSGAPGGMTPGV